MSITTITPELQEKINIDKLKSVHAKIKREEYLSKIFDDSDKAQELDFDNEVH
jgi:hypothetical protein